jgi:hypothetical protein
MSSSLVTRSSQARSYHREQRRAARTLDPEELMDISVALRAVLGLE